MEEDFYASIKLKTGEEIFARVLPCVDEEKINIILTNPIVIEPYKNRSGIQGYKVQPWMKTTTEDMFLIKMDDIITITETYDEEIIMIHQSYVKKVSSLKNSSSNKNVSRKMGYIANVNEAKKLLENIYNNS